MKQYVDIRLPEDWAIEHLGSNWGSAMPVPRGFPPMTRQVVVETSDPRLPTLRDKLSRFPSNAMSAHEYREYTSSELLEAQLLHLIITEFIEATGEEYGTVYDESNACPRCGFGRRQVSALRMDYNKIPENAQIATTIARGDEMLVSDSVAQIITENAILGCNLSFVEHVGRRSPNTRWYQLVITGEAGETVAPTRFGKDFLREDNREQSVCSEHLLSGLNLVSEVFLDSKRVANTDVLKTANRYGTRSGSLMPSSITLISQRLRRFLQMQRIRGYRVEVARLK